MTLMGLGFESLIVLAIDVESNRPLTVILSILSNKIHPVGVSASVRDTHCQSFLREFVFLSYDPVKNDETLLEQHEQG